MEVEGEVVGAAHEDHGVDEADEEDKDVVPVAEEAYRNNGVAGYLPFVKHREDVCHYPEYDEANDCWRVPGVIDAAELETK